MGFAKRAYPAPASWLPLQPASGGKRTQKRSRRHRERHPEKRKALWDAWHEKNREQNNASKKRYRQRPEIKEREKIRNREYQIQNRERLNLYGRARRYRLGVETYLAMIEEQGGRCAICGESPALLHVDHDHETGKVRELLCHGCNTGIAKFREKPELFDAAKAYLAKHKEN